MRKTFALYVILATMLCGHAVASSAASPGQYRGFADQPAGWLQTGEGGATILVVERRHEFAPQRSGGAAEAVYRYQYLFFSQVRPEQRQGEKARRLHPGFELIVASALQEERINPALLVRLEPEEPPVPVEPDPVQDVIDELEGYKSTIARIAARSEGEKKTCLEMAVAELDKAIAKLKLLQTGPPPPGIEGEIEGHLDAAIAAIAKTMPDPDTTLDRILKALRNLRANLF